jgi:hypothetical protein
MEVKEVASEAKLPAIEDEFVLDVCGVHWTAWLWPVRTRGSSRSVHDSRQLAVEAICMLGLLRDLGGS